MREGKRTRLSGKDASDLRLYFSSATGAISGLRSPSLVPTVGAATTPADYEPSEAQLAAIATFAPIHRALVGLSSLHRQILYLVYGEGLPRLVVPGGVSRLPYEPEVVPLVVYVPLVRARALRLLTRIRMARLEEIYASLAASGHRSLWHAELVSRVLPGLFAPPHPSVVLGMCREVVARCREAEFCAAAAAEASAPLGAACAAYAAALRLGQEMRAEEKASRARAHRERYRAELTGG